jgi:hypothetical protein
MLLEGDDRHAPMKRDARGVPVSCGDQAALHLSLNERALLQYPNQPVTEPSGSAAVTRSETC